MRLRQNGHAAHCFTVEHNIAEIYLAIDDRGFLSAGAGQVKSGLSLDRKTRQVKSLKVSQLNVGAGKIKTIIPAVQVVSNRPGKARAVVRELDIFQPRFCCR